MSNPPSSTSASRRISVAGQGTQLTGAVSPKKEGAWNTRSVSAQPSMPRVAAASSIVCAGPNTSAAPDASIAASLRSRLRGCITSSAANGTNASHSVSPRQRLRLP